MRISIYPILLLLFCSMHMQHASAQLLKRIQEKVQQTAEDRAVNKAGEATEKGLDKAEDGITGKKKDKKSSPEATEKSSHPNNSGSQATGATEPTLQVYSKYDFIPGEKIIFYDDFAPDAIGDFPARWNTSVSGEIVNISTLPGKWFMMKAGGSFVPEGMPVLPDNFTLEFDMLLLEASEGTPPHLQLDIYGEPSSQILDDLFPGKSGANFKLSTIRVGADNRNNNETGPIRSWLDKPIIRENKGKPVHIAIWRQKERVRLYLNETKVYDLPRLLPSNVTYSLIRFFTWDSMSEEDKLYISNIRVAAGAPDMRHKLLTEGKLVTHGILFDANSDKIKPASAGTLKEIAAVLKDNPTIKVKINGHTDSDGDDAANLALSQRRAAAVKSALNKTYDIDASRMETDGMGEKQPIADNNTPEGKASNRRVEFIKQ